MLMSSNLVTINVDTINTATITRFIGNIAARNFSIFVWTANPWSFNKNSPIVASNCWSNNREFLNDAFFSNVNIFACVAFQLQILTDEINL